MGSEMCIRDRFKRRGVEDPSNIARSGVSLNAGPSGSVGSTNKSRDFNTAITTTT